MGHRIREAWNKKMKKFSTTVEFDEAAIGKEKTGIFIRSTIWVEALREKRSWPARRIEERTN